MPYLRQSTAQTFRFGPFLDATDGVTEEVALTITPALRRLSKDGGAFAAASGAVNATHDSDGWYSASLTTTDTNTVGELILNVQVPATHLPVWMRWWVIEEVVYDLYFGAAATGLVTLAAVTHTGAVIPTVTTLTGHTAQTADHTAGIADIPTVAEFNARTILSASYFDPAADTVAAVTTTANLTTNNDKTGYALSAAGVDLIWDELMAGHVTADSAGLVMNDWQNGGRLDLILDIIAADVVNIDGIVPSAAGDAMTLTAATIDLIWDEVLTGGTHNVTNSSGRRLRQIQEAGGYSLGAVWIDTVNGAAGTENFENGVETNPSLTIADANTIAASVGLSRFSVASGSTITLAAAQENQEFFGPNWTLALGGQSISNSHIRGAGVSGIATSATEAHFEHCEMGTCTIGEAHLDNCDINATVTLSAAAEYFFIQCSHAGTSVIDFGAAVLNTTVHIHGYAGALTINNMGQAGTDVLHFDSGGGQLTLAASCIGGTVNRNGTFNFVNNGSGITDNNAGAIIEVIGTPVGVDLSADIADLPTVSEFNARTLVAASYFDPATDTVVTVTTTTNLTTNNDKTGYALSTAGVNAVADAILPETNVALANIPFLFVSSTDHVTPVTGATTITVTRSIDGAAFSAGSGTIAEIASGMYQYDASAADMNGGKIIFIFSATGGTPVAPDDSQIVVVTRSGV